MELHNLTRVKNSRSKKHRIGRGHGSGWGKTAKRGENGQNSRSGGGVSPGFEGGQNPLYRRIPKFGFTNFSRKKYTIVTLDQLNKFDTVFDINKALENKILLKTKPKLIKIVASGVLNKKIHVKAHKFTASSIAKIKEKGGEIEVIN